MFEQFLIQDVTRFIEEFKDKSFNGFKKTDVIKTLNKSMETGQVENACHWITGRMVSGYCLEIIDKLIAFASKIIHINNPRLLEYLWRKNINIFLKPLIILILKNKNN